MLRPGLPLAMLATLAAVLFAAPAPAQTPADSASALRAARQEQARFETLRRRHLGSTRAWGGGECDERIGRFCLTLGDDDDDQPDWVPPPERPPVAAARARLIERLALAAARIPGDRWVTGQRVRYLVEAKRFADARSAAAECRAEPWWCAALTGMATHYAGDARRADSAFSAMLPAMPAAVREQWTELSDVLEPGLARLYRRLPPAGRDSLAERYWGLADPFYGRPGNELRSEHFARNLLDDLQDRAESADNLRWGSDLREILLRFGWPIGWERVERTAPYAISEAAYVSHYADSDVDILPPSHIFVDSAGLAAGEWDVDRPYDRSTYALPLGDTVVSWIQPLDHQLALFHRGDSALVVAAYRLPRDTLPLGPVDVSLAATADGLTVDTVVRLSAAPDTAAVRILVPARTMVASLELVMDSSHHAARARRGLAAAPLVPGKLAVSDLLLLRDSPELPGSLEEAMRRARGSVRVRAGEGVGVFWEVYGTEGTAAGELTMALRIVGGEPGWLRRAAERARIVRSVETGQLTWRDAPAAVGIAARSLSLQIPPLPPGEYAIELSVSLLQGEPLVSRQRIDVVAEEEEEN